MKKNVHSKTASEMKPPLTALLISPSPGMRQAILERRQTGSIREGHRDYRVEQRIMLCCHIEPWAVMASIGQVRHCTLKELTPDEYRQAGFTSKRHVFSGMKAHYPNITPDSPVTFIGWCMMEGKLRDEQDILEHALFIIQSGWEAVVRQFERKPEMQSEEAASALKEERRGYQALFYLDMNRLVQRRRTDCAWSLTDKGEKLIPHLDALAPSRRGRPSRRPAKRRG